MVITILKNICYIIWLVKRFKQKHLQINAYRLDDLTALVSWHHSPHSKDIYNKTKKHFSKMQKNLSTFQKCRINLNDKK